MSNEEAPKKAPAVEEAAPKANEEDFMILARALRFLAFKVLEPSEFAEFEMRYPELKG